MVDVDGFDPEYFQFSYTQKMDYFNPFEGSPIAAPFEVIANGGIFVTNSFIEVTNITTSIVNLTLGLVQDPNTVIDNFYYSSGEYINNVIDDAKNLTPEKAAEDLQTIFSDPETYEKAAAVPPALLIGPE